MEFLLEPAGILDSRELFTFLFLIKNGNASTEAMNQVIQPSYIKAVFILLLVIIIVTILIVGKSLLVPMFLGAYISILMVPLCNRMERIKIPGILAAIISILAFMSVMITIVVLSFFQIKKFAGDLDDVRERLNTYFSHIDVFASQQLGANLGIRDGIDKSQIFDLLVSNSETLSTVLFSTLGSLPSLILIPVFSFFFLIYRGHLTNFIARLFHNHSKDKVNSEIHSLRKLVHYYIIGIFKVMAILAVLNTVALYLLGVKHALFFGLFAALLNIIPYIGPLLGAVLPFIYTFLTMDGFFYPFSIVVLFTLIQLIEGNFLTPKIVGSNVNLNPLITFTGLLVGGAIWGVIGMILIIPTLAILKRIFQLSPSSSPYAYLLGEEENDN